jgi:hypothetical protein
MTTPPRRPDERYEANPDVVFEELDTEVVLLDPNTGNFFGLNSTGQIVWRALKNGASVEDLVGQLRALTEAPQEVRTDVEDLLDDLEERALIRRVGPRLGS